MSAAAEVAGLVWPASRLPEALSDLARSVGLRVDSGRQETSRHSRHDCPETVAERLDLRCVNVESPLSDLSSMLEQAAPALLRMGSTDDYLVVARSGRRWLTLLDPQRRRRRVALDVVRRSLEEPLVEYARGSVEELVHSAQVEPGLRTETTTRLLEQRLGHFPYRGCWTLDLHEQSSTLDQVKAARLPQLAGALFVAHAAQFLLWIAAWWLIGSAILDNRPDRGWLTAWMLAMLTILPIRLASSWLQGRVAIAASVILKRRLFDTALGARREDLQRDGAGHLVARVAEAEAVESLVVSGGMRATTAVVELLLALPVLALAAGGWAHSALLAAFLVLLALTAFFQYRRQLAWTGSRLELSDSLIERMIGHRTRLVQQSADAEGPRDHAQLSRYGRSSADLDRLTLWQDVALGHGWMLASLLVLAPALMSFAQGPGAVAAALGGTLLAHGAYRQLLGGLDDLIGASVAFEQVRPLLRSRSGDASLGATPRVDRPDTLRLEKVGYRYDSNARPVLESVDLHLSPGDRMLIEGTSGCGKSTLLDVLGGLRSPDKGLRLLGGLDRQTWGHQGWTRGVALVPQFHQNHLFSESLAFNLLMGRRWPAEPEDLELAEKICRELGLGDLLDRLPSGLSQLVGETGWDLSHGERGRVFLARALLQDAPLVLLDESFAALDPESLQLAHACADRRAKTLVVVAHP